MDRVPVCKKRAFLVRPSATCPRRTSPRRGVKNRPKSHSTRRFVSRYAAISKGHLRSTESRIGRFDPRLRVDSPQGESRRKSNQTPMHGCLRCMAALCLPPQPRRSYLAWRDDPDIPADSAGAAPCRAAPRPLDRPPSNGAGGAKMHQLPGRISVSIVSTFPDSNMEPLAPCEKFPAFSAVKGELDPPAAAPPRVDA